MPIRRTARNFPHLTCNWSTPNFFYLATQATLATLKQICLICKSCQYPLRNLSEDCQYPLTHLQEDCPNKIQRFSHCAIPLKKVKFKVENQEATDSFKNYWGSSPNNALSIHNTNSPSQSHETVPLNTFIEKILFDFLSKVRAYPWIWWCFCIFRTAWSLYCPLSPASPSVYQTPLPRPPRPPPPRPSAGRGPTFCTSLPHCL